MRLTEISNFDWEFCLESLAANGGVLVSTDRWRHRRHAEEAWLASLKTLGKQINANDYEDLALAA